MTIREGVLRAQRQDRTFILGPSTASKTKLLSFDMGRDSSVGIATRYRVDGQGIESRWGAKFSAPVQYGPGAHPTFCTMGTGSFPGEKRPGRGADHPPPSKSRGHERVGLYFYSPSGPQWPVLGRTLPLLSFDKMQSRVFAGLLTGQNALKNVCT